MLVLKHLTLNIGSDLPYFNVDIWVYRNQRYEIWKCWSNETSTFTYYMSDLNVVFVRLVPPLMTNAFHINKAIISCNFLVFKVPPQQYSLNCIYANADILHKCFIRFAHSQNKELAHSCSLHRLYYSCKEHLSCWPCS